jgi:hypothetical protein
MFFLSRYHRTHMRTARVHRTHSNVVMQGILCRRACSIVRCFWSVPGGG